MEEKKCGECGVLITKENAPKHRSSKCLLCFNKHHANYMRMREKEIIKKLQTQPHEGFCRKCGIKIQIVRGHKSYPDYCYEHYREIANANFAKHYAKRSADIVWHKSKIFSTNNVGSGMTRDQLEGMLARQMRKCKVCQDDLSKVRWEIDHIIPVSVGGAHDPANLQILCKRCNRAKDNGTMEDFLKWVKRISERINQHADDES